MCEGACVSFFLFFSKESDKNYLVSSQNSGVIQILVFIEAN